MDKWMDFANRLLKNYKRLSKTAHRQQTTAFRIFDNDLPSFPFVIEMYGDCVQVAEYHRRHGMDESEHAEWLDLCLDCIARTLEMSLEHIYLKERKRMSHRSDQYEKQAEQNDFFVVQECGYDFWVNLTDYLDSGLFLDHRVTRNMVRDQSQGKKVLNLFCYTGAFSVYAAKGGAAQVTSVDLSKTYLQWAQRNFELNGIPVSQHEFVHADVLQYLTSLPANAFDLIIMDPPTFSNSKRMDDILDIQRDHVVLINDALKALRPEGTLYFSTNFTRFEMDASQIKASYIKDITKATVPFDFSPSKLKRWCYQIKH